MFSACLVFHACFTMFLHRLLHVSHVYMDAIAGQPAMAGDALRKGMIQGGSRVQANLDKSCTGWLNKV